VGCLGFSVFRDVGFVTDLAEVWDDFLLLSGFFMALPHPNASFRDDRIGFRGPSRRLTWRHSLLKFGLPYHVISFATLVSSGAARPRRLATGLRRQMSGQHAETSGRHRRSCAPGKRFEE